MKELHVKHVTAGFDFTFGSKGAGTMEQMTALSDGAYGTTVVEKVTDDEEKISSTRIRNFYQKGMLKRRHRFLGRPFRTVGIVVDGEKEEGCSVFRQRTFYLRKILCCLQMASMQSVLLWMARRMNGVCNVGVKPTFHDPE